MARASLCLFVSCVALCPGADKKPPEGRAANEAVEIIAKAYCGKDAVRQVIGSDLGGYIVVVDVQLTPKSDKPLAVSLDNFTLRSDKDGQRSQPFAPSQIAGRGALVLSSSGRGSGMMVEESGPVWGGTMGRPRRLGGDGVGLGTSATSTQATIHSGTKEKEDPLLATLKEKVLPQEETSEPVSGLLYFLMEGKHKPKQLELYYKGPAGNLSLRFR